jgi:ComF family protein
VHWLEKWILPPTCVLLGEPTETQDISSHLVKQWPVPDQVCPQCCEPSARGEVCGACLLKPPAFDRTQVGFYFDRELIDLVYGLKYRNKVAYARILAELLAPRLQAEGVEALLSVPLHPVRRRQRGYNQAHLLATELSRQLRVPVIGQALQRCKDTASQTHLDAAQRRRNLEGAFVVQASLLRDIKKIALVDDVITTGATMQQLAKAIKQQSEIVHIQAWAVAKTK